jgi:hypothetical protein
MAYLRILAVIPALQIKETVFIFEGAYIGKRRFFIRLKETLCRIYPVLWLDVGLTAPHHKK